MNHPKRTKIGEGKRENGSVVTMVWFFLMDLVEWIKIVRFSFM